MLKILPPVIWYRIYAFEINPDDDFGFLISFFSFILTEMHFVTLLFLDLRVRIR